MRQLRRQQYDRATAARDPAHLGQDGRGEVLPLAGRPGSRPGRQPRYASAYALIGQQQLAGVAKLDAGGGRLPGGGLDG